MFCPEGYISLYDVSAIFDGFAFSQTPRSDDIELQLEGGFDIDTGPPQDEENAYAKWLMLAFLEIYGDDIRVALPSGTVAKISRWALAGRFSSFASEDWLDFNEYWYFPKMRFVRLAVLKNELRYIDEESFTIDCRKAKVLPVQTGLSHIHGCPLCIREGIFPNDYGLVEHVEAALKARLLGDGTTSSFDASGNPLVEKIIRLVASRGVSRDQAKAMLGRNTKAEEWRALWRQAALQRPDLRLSVPGPKGPRKS